MERWVLGEGRQLVKALETAQRFGRPSKLLDEDTATVLLDAIRECALAPRVFARAVATLTVDDVDLSESLLVVRNTKFFKTRLLPIGPKLSSALRLYAGKRLALVDRPPSATTFLLHRRGSAISRQCAERYFRTIRHRLGIKRLDGAYFQPRLHDLRHAFAVHRVVAWYQQGADVQLLLPKLSTYLGHVRLADTQPYLSMTPELLREASRRFEGYAQPEVRP